MPVWIPPRGEEAGGNQISNKRALAKGLTFHPLADTTRDTVAWLKSQPTERQAKLKAGLTPEREAEVLVAWHKLQK
jgi:2'-hydroxyisoflavone reductase